MNLALWLERAGRSYRERPAVGHGTRVMMSYGELAERAARLPRPLRDRHGLAPGERVVIAAKNAPEYLEMLYGVWHAGLAAVPANAKLHGRELGYILEHSGARVCFASDGLDAEIAPHAPASLERLITVGGADYAALFAADAIACAPRAPDDLAWLFYTSGTTGRPKGAMLTHRVLAVASHAYLAEVDPTAPGEPILHAAPMSHGSGLYAMGNVARYAVNVVPESGGFEPEEIFRLFDAWPKSSMFAAPTMVKRLIECPAGCNETNIRTIVWGGAPMYVEDALRALDRFGPCFAQIYGQGESPMTITVLPREDIAAREHPRWRERRNPLPRRQRDGGLLARPGRERARPARRLAAYRRRRRLRRGGLSHAQGPLQGRGDLGRLQHLSARDRGGSAHPFGRARGFRDRPARPRVGRGRGRLCGGRGRGERPRCAVPFRGRAFQAPQGLRVRRDAAEEQLWQNPQDRAAGDGCEAEQVKRSPGAAQRVAVRCRPGVHACCPWTPGQHRSTACRGAPGE